MDRWTIDGRLDKRGCWMLNALPVFLLCFKHRLSKIKRKWKLWIPRQEVPVDRAWQMLKTESNSYLQLLYTAGPWLKKKQKKNLSCFSHSTAPQTSVAHTFVSAKKQLKVFMVQPWWPVLLPMYLSHICHSHPQSIIYLCLFSPSLPDIYFFLQVWNCHFVKKLKLKSSHLFWLRSLTAVVETPWWNEPPDERRAPVGGKIWLNDFPSLPRFVSISLALDEFLLSVHPPSLIFYRNCVFQKRWVRLDNENLAYYNNDKVCRLSFRHSSSFFLHAVQNSA